MTSRDAGAVRLWRCGDDFSREEPRGCSCDNPEMQADVGPHDTNGDEIAKYVALPKADHDALLDRLARVEGALEFLMTVISMRTDLNASRDPDIVTAIRKARAALDDAKRSEALGREG